jgi:dolichol kinase
MERIKLLLINIVTVAAISTLLEWLIDAANISKFGAADSASPAFFAFPSVYVAEAFSLVFPLLGDVLFPLSYLFAVLVSLFQSPAVANPWLDIGVGLAIAGLGYNIAEAIVFRQKEAIDRLDERERKAAHVLSNLSACLVIWILGLQTASYLVLSALFVGIPAMHLTTIGIKIPGIDEWLKRVGRVGETPGEGPLYNALGILFALGLLRSNPLAAVVVILMFGLGDGFATYTGTTYGKHKLPWNRNKTMEGTLGFMAGAMCALLIMPVSATVLVAALAAIVESLPLKLNDNITLPVVLSLLFYLLL